MFRRSCWFLGSLASHKNFILANFRLKLSTCGAYIWFVFCPDVLLQYYKFMGTYFFHESLKILSRKFPFKWKITKLQNFKPSKYLGYTVRTAKIFCEVHDNYYEGLCMYITPALISVMVQFTFKLASNHLWKWIDWKQIWCEL